MLIGGMLSFSSQGGDLYSSQTYDPYDGSVVDDRITTIGIIPSLFYFISPGIGFGGDLSYNRMSQGDNSSTTWADGPKIGYFIDSGSNTIPYVGGGVNYLSIGDQDNSENGFRLNLVVEY